MTQLITQNKLPVVFPIIIALFTVFSSTAQSWDEVAKAFPSPFQEFLTNLEFGSSVDIDGNQAVIGITSSYTNFKQVSVLEKDSLGWQKIATLYPADSTGFGFGAQVAIENGVVVVGYSLYSSSAGHVYVYEEPVGGWIDTIPTAILSPSNGYYGNFGSSVDISNNTIAVGQLYWSGFPGKILVYEKPTGGWVNMVENAILTPSSALNLNTISFGSSVSIDSNVIVAGAHNELYLGQQSGTAYIFEQGTGGWLSGTETSKIYPSNGGNLDKFGFDVSISGNNIVIGAPSNDSFGNESGAAYVYTKTSSSWSGTTTETAVLSSSIMDSLDNFGESVSIEDSVVLVGAPSTFIYPKRSGVCFVFEEPQGGWVDSQETAYLISSDRSPNDFFGCSVATGSGNAIIGAKGDDDYGPNSGSAYLFSEDSNGWQNSIEEKKIWPNQLLKTYSSAPLFGISVAIDDRYAVVGATTPASGSTDIVYVLYYNDTSWVTLGSLFPSDPEVGKRFGKSVAIEGDYIVVGAPFDTPQTSFGTGAVYLFKKPMGGWRTMSESAKLTSSITSGTHHNLGESVSISGNIVVGGAPNAPSNQTSYTGAVCLFEKPAIGWHDTTETAILTYDQAVGGTNLGFSIEIDGDVVISGAPRMSASGTVANKAFIFEKPSAGWGDMTQTAVLTKSSGLNDKFGYDVSIDSNLIAVSAIDEFTGVQGVGEGLVYLFEKPTSGWSDTTESFILSHTPDANGSGNFGSSIDIDADTVVVGAENHSSISTGGSGAIYTYVKGASGWKDTTETRRYYPNVGETGQLYGRSVEMDNGFIIVGSMFDSIGNIPSTFNPPGSAFLLKSCLSTPDTIVLSECNYYVLPSGYKVTSSGIYNDYINMGFGCDSVMIFDLTISDVDTNIYVSGNEIFCSEISADSYQWLDCDTGFNPISGADSSMFTPGVSQGNYAVELTKNGCIDTTDCFLYLDCYPTYDSLFVTSCGPYTSPSGNYVWSVWGTYADTIINAQGCDSILTVFYQNYSLDASVVQNNNQLLCTTSNQVYQWVDCDNGYSPISGQNLQFFNPITNGNYAVIVSNNLCSDTSACYTINTISVKETDSLELTITPNPTDDLLFVNSNTIIDQIKLEDMSGKTLLTQKVFKESTQINLLNLPNGIYLLSVLSIDGCVYINKIIKTN